jgi:signal transduction histidine kinase
MAALPAGASADLSTASRTTDEPRIGAASFEQHLSTSNRDRKRQIAQAQLIDGVAHDFNNVLTAILGNLSLLLDGALPPERTTEILATIEKVALRATGLVQQLLDSAPSAAHGLQPLDLGVVVKDTVDLLRNITDERINFRVTTQPDLALIQADATRIDQLIMNLCLNARDAMPAGGTVTVETAAVIVTDPRACRHADARQGEFVRLRIGDTGVGIPADVRPRIFEPYFTTKRAARGAGLGLAMADSIVRQHNGWIDVTTAVGAGTTFDVYFPRL